MLHERRIEKLEKQLAEIAESALEVVKELKERIAVLEASNGCKHERDDDGNYVYEVTRSNRHTSAYDLKVEALRCVHCRALFLPGGA